MKIKLKGANIYMEMIDDTSMNEKLWVKLFEKTAK